MSITPKCRRRNRPVRIEGARGELVATQLIEAAAGDAGPIVCEVIGYRWMYFLLPRGEVRAHDWPLGVQQLGGKASLSLTYIGIPALDGNTWPLRWYSEPTVTAPFVEAGLLRAVLARRRGRRSEPPEGGM